MALYEEWHGSSEWITMNELEMWYGSQAGAEMRKKSVADGRRNRHDWSGFEGSAGDRIQSLGVYCEPIAAKCLVTYWEPKTDWFGPDLPHNIEVKLVGKKHYGLRVYPDIPPDRRVIGVCIPKGEERSMRYRVVGWYMAGDAQQHKEWEMAPHGRAPMFCVPQRELRHPAELRAIMAEEVLQASERTLAKLGRPRTVRVVSDHVAIRPEEGSMTTETDRAPLPAVPERNGMHTGSPAYLEFTPEMRKLIRNSILPADANDTDLYYLLELAATYKLDPFTHEIWAVKMPGKNASGSGVVIMVGRDGLLAIAERNPDYRGFRCEAYYTNDVLRKLSSPTEQPDGTFTYVQHEFDINGDRGELMGAWAEVYRAGRPPVFFNARLEEYAKGGEYSPWQKQKTVMIEKCALATALRLTYRISGLYLADEMSGAMLDRADEAVKQAGPVTGLNLGDDPTVAAWLEALFGRLAEAKPDEYLPGKQRLLLAPLDAAGREELATTLQQVLYEATGELVAKPTPEEAETEVVEDAEVVDEVPSDVK